MHGTDAARVRAIGRKAAAVRERAAGGEEVTETSDAGAGKASNRTLYVVSLNHFVNDSSTYLIASLFPAVISAFGFSVLEIGVLVALGYVMNMVFQPLTGRLSERYEERMLLAIGISSMAVSMLMFTLSNTFYTMLASVAVLRFGSSFYHPVGVSAVSRTYRGTKLDDSMGFQSSFGNLGVMLAFLLSAPLYLAFGWRGPFMIYAALQVGVVVLTSVAMPGRATTEGHLVEEPSGHGATGSEGGDAAGTRTSGQASLLGLPLFFFFAALVSGGAYSIFSNFGNLFLVHVGFQLTTANDMIAVWVASAFVGAIGSGWLTKRLGRDRVLLATYLFAGLAGFLFIFSHGDVLLVLASLAVGGFMDSITYPTIYSELSAFLDRNPATSRGTAYGVLFSGQIAGSAFFGILTGYLAEAYTLAIPFAIAASMLVFYAAVVHLWAGRK